MMNKNFKWILPVLSGILLILGFPPFSFPILPFFSIIPLFLFIKSSNVKQSFFGGSLTGFIFLGWVMSWMFEVIFTAITEAWWQPLNYFLLFLVWVSITSFFSLFFGLFSLFYSRLKFNKIRDIVLTSSLWIIFEYLRAWGFGLIQAGDKAYFPGAHWTMGNLAYSMSSNGLFRFLASIGGIYLVSFFIVLINSILFFLIINLSHKNNINRQFVVAVAILLSIFISYFFIISPNVSQNNRSFNIAVLNTKIMFSTRPTPEMNEEKRQIQNKMLEKVREKYPETEIVFFPEVSNFLKENRINEDYFGDKDVLIIDSEKIIDKDDNEKFLGLFYSTKRGLLGEYQKIILLPYSDYYPFVFRAVINFVPWEKLDPYKIFEDRKRGENPVVIESLGLLLCSDSISPDLHRKLSNMGAQIFLNAGSLAFSNDSKNLDEQTLAMLQFRAAENGRYLVRSTNYGSSFIIDNRGNVLIKSVGLKNQIIYRRVPLISGKTFYSITGDWILILATISLTFLFFGENGNNSSIISREFLYSLFNLQ